TNAERLLGLLVCSLALALLLYSVIKTWKFVQRANELTSKPSNRSALVLGGVTGLTAMVVHSIFDFNMHIPANALTAVALMALVASHIRFATERHWFNPGWIGRIVLTGA